MTIANGVVAPTVNGAPPKNRMRISLDEGPAPAPDVAARPLRPEITPDVANGLLRDLFLGREHPMYYAEMAGVKLHEFAQIAAHPNHRESVRELAQLMQLHQLAVFNRIKANAAHHLNNLLSSSGDRIPEPCSARIRIDLCLEIMKLRAPGLNSVIFKE